MNREKRIKLQEAFASKLVDGMSLDELKHHAYVEMDEWLDDLGDEDFMCAIEDSPYSLEDFWEGEV